VVTAIQNGEELFLCDKERAWNEFSSASVAVGAVIPSPVGAVMLHSPPSAILSPAGLAHNHRAPQCDVIVHIHGSKLALGLDDSIGVGLHPDLIHQGVRFFQRQSYVVSTGRHKSTVLLFRALKNESQPQLTFLCAVGVFWCGDSLTFFYRENAIRSWSPVRRHPSRRDFRKNHSLERRYHHNRRYRPQWLWLNFCE
jgi:hypothetical protein